MSNFYTFRIIPFNTYNKKGQRHISKQQTMLTIASNMANPIPTTLNPSPPPASGNLPLRSIPGGYGWPIIGPISDRINYFWFQGPENFFRKRMDQHKSSVFRTNVPPCFPFFLGVNPNVIAVLDVQSFSHLFDMEIIEKKNILVGDFMPSVKFTGNMRVCAYLDPTEEKHTKVKNFTLDILKRSSSVWVSYLLSSLDTMWTSIDDSLAKDGKVSYFFPLQKCLFNFLAKSIVGGDPANYSSKLAESGHIMFDKWLALMLVPTVYIGLLQPLEEIFLHSFSYPSFLVKGDYDTLYDFINQEGKEIVERGQVEFGLSREEIIHNLIFIFGFNAFGGFSLLLRVLFSILGSDTGRIQDILRQEVRKNCGTTGELNFSTVKKLPLIESFVYEALRLNPPVPLQYGRARKDFILQSHDSMFEVKKGELLCGFQKLVMRDPKVFEAPETFVHDRFASEKGCEMLSYLYWSNGPQTGEANSSNKQCAAKDFVPLTSCLILAHLLQKYDSITIDSSGNITKAKRAK